MSLSLKTLRNLKRGKYKLKVYPDSPIGHVEIIRISNGNIIGETTQEVLNQTFPHGWHQFQ